MPDAVRLGAAGSLWNTPRDDDGGELPAAGPTPTASVFRPGVHAA
jgi:hypothetical protein